MPWASAKFTLKPFSNKWGNRLWLLSFFKLTPIIKSKTITTMKSIILTLTAACIIIGCKPSDQLLSPTHYVDGMYRAGLISMEGDTTWTNTRTVITETIGLDSAFDSKLKVVLVNYDGHGVFTVTVTNLTTCQGIIRWNWDGNFKIDSIGYASNNPLDPSNDVLHAGETKTFKLYTQPKVGRLKIKLMNSVGNCGNSSELIINITTSILPIKYTNFTATYDRESDHVFIGFTTSEPKSLKWILIQQQVGQEYKTILHVAGDDNITSYKIKLP
jgi:hypothetical protein